jgi:autotransporter-associated beta strand protein
MRFVRRIWQKKNGSQPARFRPRLTPLEDRTLPSVTLLQSVAGLNSNVPGSQGLEPPDTDAAAGPNHVVEIVNNSLRFYDKAGSVLSTQTLANFFAPLSPANQSDPYVLFDDGVSNASGPAGRFIISVLDYTSTSAPNSLDFAVSNDADPTHGFTEMQKINVGEGSFFADFPREGFNAGAYVYTFNMFTTSFGFFDHVEELSIDKSTVITGTNQTPTTYRNDITSGLFTMAPAVMHNSSGNAMWFVTEGLNANTIDVVQMPNALTSAATFQDNNLAVSAYGAPPNASQPGGTINTNDTRILNAAWRNNTLVADQTVGTGGHAHARWYQFDLSGSTPQLSQWGEIAPAGGADTYYPSIEINQSGSLGMTYMESSSSEYMSMYVTGRSATDPAGTMEASQLAAAGAGTYTGTRAGDFSGITVDPSDGTTFWAANEVKPSGAFWGTQVAEFTVQTAATRTWTGGGTTTHWSDPNNWSGGVAPNPGDSLVFGPSASSFTSTNDFAAGTAFGAITLSGAGYTVSGNAIQLTGGIDASTATGSNSFGLGITLSASQAFNAGNSPTDLTVGGTVSLGGFTLTVGGGSGELDLTNTVSGTGGLTVNNAGTTVLEGPSDTYTGATTVQGGTLLLRATAGNAVAGALTVGAATVRLGAGNQIADTSAVTVNASGLLDTANNSDTIGALALSGGSVTTGTGTLTLGGNVTAGGVSTVSGNLSLGGSTRTFTVSASATLTVSATVSGTAGLTAAGSGTLVLSAANSYSGGTTLSGGTLAVGNNGALGGGTLTLTGGTLMASGAAVSLANAVTLGGNVTIGGSLAVTFTGLATLTGSRTLTVSNTALTTFAGAVGQSASGLRLTKAGSGTLVLAAANTYTGATTVSAGTLLVNGSVKSATTVNSGATLGGSGTLRAVTVKSGGTLLPGSAAQTAVLNSGSVTLSSGSSFNVALDGASPGPGGYDQLNVTGTVNLTGSTLNVSVGFSASVGESFTLINNDKTDAVKGTFSGLAEGATFVAGGMTFQITYKGGTGNDVVITRVA